MPPRPGTARTPIALTPDSGAAALRSLLTFILGRNGRLQELIAGEVRAAMGRRRVSGVKLAQQLGVSRAFVWRRMQDETAFNLDDLEALSLVLDVTLEQLLLPAIREVDRLRAEGRYDELLLGDSDKCSCSNSAGQHRALTAVPPTGRRAVTLRCGHWSDARIAS